MKTLYIAPFRDFSGYATAARGYLKALDLAGVDLVARAVRYDRADPGSEYQLTPREKELLQKPLEDIEVVIQHVTPNEMRVPKAVADKTNVAVVAWETTRIPDYWVRRLNGFDLVVTFCDASVRAFRDCGVTTPIEKVPHCFDIKGNTYDLSEVEPLRVERASDFLEGRFVFYNISQFSQKKGLDVLLQAYYSAFWDKPDDVALVLKTYINMGSNRKDERDQLASWIQQLRGGMRLPSYPPVILITDTISDEKIRRLHSLGDCYVCSSRAEGWCIPAFEGLAYGNKLVTTRWGGMGEFTRHPISALMLDQNVFQVDFTMEPLIGQQHNDPDLYTARDLIAQPSVRSMAHAMQVARKARLDPKPDLSHFDYSEVGPQMKRVLEGAANVGQPV